MHFPSFLEDILQKESEIIGTLIKSLKNMDFIILLAIIKHIFLLWYTPCNYRHTPSSHTGTNIIK